MRDLDEKIRAFDKAAIEIVVSIFVSMVTAVIITKLCLSILSPLK